MFYKVYKILVFSFYTSFNNESVHTLLWFYWNSSWRKTIKSAYSLTKILDTQGIYSHHF